MGAEGEKGKVLWKNIALNMTELGIFAAAFGIPFITVAWLSSLFIREINPRLVFAMGQAGMLYGAITYAGLGKIRPIYQRKKS